MVVFKYEKIVLDFKNCLLLTFKKDILHLMNKLALKHFIKLNALELPTSFHNRLNLVLLTFHYFTINNIKIGNKIQNISTFPNITLRYSKIFQ